MSDDGLQAPCRNCGVRNERGRDFCERCGEYLSWAPTMHIAAVQAGTSEADARHLESDDGSSSEGTISAERAPEARAEGERLAEREADEQEDFEAPAADAAPPASSADEEDLMPPSAAEEPEDLDRPIGVIRVRQLPSDRPPSAGDRARARAAGGGARA